MAIFGVQIRKKYMPYNETQTKENQMKDKLKKAASSTKKFVVAHKTGLAFIAGVLS